MNSQSTADSASSDAATAQTGAFQPYLHVQYHYDDQNIAISSIDYPYCYCSIHGADVYASVIFTYIIILYTYDACIYMLYRGGTRRADSASTRRALPPVSNETPSMS